MRSGSRSRDCHSRCAIEKGVALATLSLRSASLPCISRSLASRLAGAYTSTLMFRRCLCNILDKIFAFGSRDSDDASQVFALPRSVAEEIVLASVLSLVAVTHISATYDSHVYMLLMLRSVVVRLRRSTLVLALRRPCGWEATRGDAIPCLVHLQDLDSEL